MPAAREIGGGSMEGGSAGPGGPLEGAPGAEGFGAVAIEAAVAAGRLIRPWAGRARGVGTKASASDLVTDLDRESERLISELLHARFPAHAIHGEEGGARGQEGDFVWHVDPIDGTTNFVHGLPGYCVSVALAWRGVPVAGAVYDPTADELFAAVRGGGAHANGRPLRVSTEDRLSASLVGTGVPPVQPSRDFAFRTVRAVAPEVRNLRNIGSAALHLAYVAAGRLSGFWEPGLRPWDCAAGVLLVREAGGRASDLSGEDWHTGLRGALGTNGAIHDALLALLAPLPEAP